jgi:hypothetical protein
MVSKGNDGGDGPLAKDFVAVRVNVTSAQLNQVLTALGISRKLRASFGSGQVFIMQKRKPTTRKKRAKK